MNIELIKKHYSARLVFAFLCTPLVFGFVLLLVSSLNGGTGGLWLFIFTVFTGYVIIFTFGLVAYLLLSILKVTGLISYLVIGGLISLIPITYFVLYPSIGGVREGDVVFSMPKLVQSVCILFACLISTCVFWVIARPDTQFKR